MSWAVAGAPVTEWRLYDTHYTERYLGNPAIDADAYERTSLLRDAWRLERPLLLIHGLADDNVFAEFLLEKAGVAGVPGSGFGAPGHIRFSFAVSMQTLEKALERMGKVLG